MKKEIRKEIRKALKAVGSHTGTVKEMLSEKFPAEAWADWIEFTRKEIAKKHAK